MCQNVATVKAIYDAIITGYPLVSRVLSVNGNGVQKPQNYMVRIGTEFTDIISHSMPVQHPYSISIGGLMMGQMLPDANYAVDKTTNCLFINQLATKSEPKPCIRCNTCNTVCPINLLPQQLFWYSKSENIAKAMDYNLLSCIECGCCTYVCPSEILLVDYFAHAKALHRKQVIEQQKIDTSRQRFEYRTFRLERNAKERTLMMAAKRKALTAKMAQQQDKINAALKRSKSSNEINQ